jgi:O-antigen ligase
MSGAHGLSSRSIQLGGSDLTTAAVVSLIVSAAVVVSTGAAIGVAFGAAFIIWALLSPRLGLLILAGFSVCIQYLERISLGTASALWIAGAVVPATFLVAAGARRLPLATTATRRFAWFLLLALLVTVPFPSRRVDPLTGFAQWTKYLNGFVVLWLASTTIRRREHADGVVQASLLAMVVPGGLAMYQIVSGDLTPYWFGARNVIDAFYHHPGVIAFALMFTFPLVLHCFVVSRPRRRWWWSILIVLWVVGIVFTFRRAVWVTVAVQIVVWLLLRRAFTTLAAVFALAAVVIAASPEIQMVVAERFSAFTGLGLAFQHPELLRRDDLALLLNRWAIFKAVLDGWAGTGTVGYFLGAGIGSSAAFTSAAGLPPVGAHSVYLTLLAETGLIGTTLFFSVLVAAARSAAKLRATLDPRQREFGNTYMVVLVTFLVAGLANHLVLELSSGVWMFWILTGTTLGLSRDLVTKRTRTAR